MAERIYEYVLGLRHIAPGRYVCQRQPPIWHAIGLFGVPRCHRDRATVGEPTTDTLLVMTSGLRLCGACRRRTYQHAMRRLLLDVPDGCVYGHAADVEPGSDLWWQSKPYPVLERVAVFYGWQRWRIRFTLDGRPPLELHSDVPILRKPVGVLVG